VKRSSPRREATRGAPEGARTPPLHELSVEEARRRELAAFRASPGRPWPNVVVDDHVAPSPAGPIPLRLYRPPGAPGSLPTLVYFFGGGWVLGSLEIAEPLCRRLAVATPCAVLAVGYRLAPEHRFPAAVEDCYAAARWAAEHGPRLGLDPGRVAVGGVSAGGNLAAAVTLLAREHGNPRLDFQLLVYPPLLFGADTPSMRAEGDADGFDRRTVAWCWSHYLAEPADGGNPLASPLLEPDLSSLPPALVVTAELDPLRDEGEQYAGRLAEAGGSVRLVRYEGVAHGFFSMSGILAAADEAQHLVAATLHAAFERERFAGGRRAPVGKVGG
jgi:acetyl esterase